LGACASTPPSTGGAAAVAGGRAADPADAAIVLVSIDGFRADALDPANTPNLVALAARGIRSEGLIPSFPTKTFPNHFSIVTGLVPDHHGLVANNIWDPHREKTYGLGDREAVGDAAWYEGVPLWVTAERHGMATAPLFWPGSEAPIGGRRPTYWQHYDGDMAYEARVEWVLDRLEGAESDEAGESAEGPPVRFATLYFDAVDTAGHRFGPGAPGTRAAEARVDSMIGRLIDGLDARSLADRVDVIVVSDHGMSQLSRDRVIFLDDYLDPDSTRVVDWSPVLAIWPPDDTGREYDILKGAHPHLHIYRPDEIPARYGFGENDRVAPVVGIVDPGWSLTTHAYFDRNPERFDGGNHGYDQDSEDMRALFVAAGPSFRQGVVAAPFPNVDVYELMMRILRLPPEPGDGRLDRVAPLLVPTAAPVPAGR
jgi:predicted AlkP superfamily pyrophosphatase or phosphodiesterase